MSVLVCGAGCTTRVPPSSHPVRSFLPGFFSKKPRFPFLWEIVLEKDQIRSVKTENSSRSSRACGRRGKPGSLRESGRNRKFPARGGRICYNNYIPSEPSFIHHSARSSGFFRSPAPAGWGNTSGGRGKLRPLLSGNRTFRPRIGRDICLWKLSVVGKDAAFLK